MLSPFGTYYICPLCHFFHPPFPPPPFPLLLLISATFVYFYFSLSIKRHKSHSLSPPKQICVRCKSKRHKPGHVSHTPRGVISYHILSNFCMNWIIGVIRITETNCIATLLSFLYGTVHFLFCFIFFLSFLLSFIYLDVAFRLLAKYLYPLGYLFTQTGRVLPCLMWTDIFVSLEFMM